MSWEGGGEKEKRKRKTLAQVDLNEVTHIDLKEREREWDLKDALNLEWNR